MPPSANSAWISAYIALSKGVGGVYLTFGKSFDKLNEFYEQLLLQREDIERSFGDRLSWERNGDKIFIGAPNVLFNDLKQDDQRQHVIAYLAEMTNRMVNAFRHRLNAISEEK